MYSGTRTRSKRKRRRVTAEVHSEVANAQSEEDVQIPIIDQHSSSNIQRDIQSAIAEAVSVIVDQLKNIQSAPEQPHSLDEICNN